MAESLNGRRSAVDAIRFTLPGFTNADDPALLAHLLATYITRVHEVDATGPPLDREA
ncbi:hypothetical protein PARHAE_03564 [Paracoccus haematequi]|uniref:Uncharacterized protein n=1 Tax=Paracoccus haematequi TaxID=2491866 RepID=A0A3S4DE37_9RHOB|nr:hypothetical protein PARHAE_03564 [Paracoccus haematequi]